MVRITPDGVELASDDDMDTKTLVVGQEIYMFSSGIYLNKGKVVEVTPSGVDVQTDGQELLRFNNNGKETDASRRDRLGFGPSPESKFHTVLWFSAPECQPWELDDMSFVERTALLEQARRDYEAKKKLS